MCAGGEASLLKNLGVTHHLHNETGSLLSRPTLAFFAFFHALRNTWATNELRLSMAVRSHECLFRSAVLFCPQNYERGERGKQS
jgi:hypothetical protein